MNPNPPCPCPAIFTSWEIDPVGAIFQTRMMRFESAVGISGLARDNGAGMIELLAVRASDPGKGRFRALIVQLKINYQTICIWHVDNPILPAILERYGFTPEETVEEHGDRVTGYRWDFKP